MTCSPLILLFVTALGAAEVSIATWRGDAEGALSLIVDDFARGYFGDVALIERVCDATGVKLTFAANTHTADVPRAVQGYDAWGYARRMLAKGHEVHSHSATHDSADWVGAALALEVLESRAVIERELMPWRSYLFVFPNKSKDANGVGNELAFIRDNGYLGARPNAKSPTAGFPGITPKTIPDPFRITTWFYQENRGVGMLLDKIIDPAIASGDWATPTFHNLGSERGWGWMSAASFRQLADAIAERTSDGRLWCAGAQAVLMYALQREHWGTAIERVDGGYVVGLRPPVDPIAPGLDNAIFTQPLTLRIQVDGARPEHARQDGHQRELRVEGGVILVDVDPHGGPIELR